MGKDKSFVYHKLKPVLIENEYFYQTVEGERNGNQQRQILYTRNDQGHLISEYPIPVQKLGTSYENSVQDKPENFIGDKGKVVIVRNDRREEVFTQILRPTKSQVFKEDLEEELENTNFRKS